MSGPGPRGRWLERWPLYPVAVLASYVMLIGPSQHLTLVNMLQTVGSVVFLISVVLGYRSSLVQELSKRCPGSSIMVQVYLAQNESQGGCHITEASQLISLATSAGLEVTGLMAIGPQGDTASIRAAYQDLVLLADDQGLHHRSIGMSNDLEIAIESGSTMVRIGTALFGDRPTR